MSLINKPRILISILNWNGNQKTINCLNSIYKSENKSFTVIVIDNASSDNSLDDIYQYFPQVVVIKNEYNLGFTVGQNQGITYAINNGYDYVWILNNDTIIDQKSLNYMVDKMEEDSSIGSLSPVVFSSEYPDTSKIQFCGTSIDWKQIKFKLFDQLQPALKSQELDPYNFCLWGTALLIRISLLKIIGGFSEKYFAYYEDMDLSVRISQAGFLNKIVPEAKVFHVGVASPSDRPAYFYYLMTRNKYLFWDSHLSGKHLLRFRKEYLIESILTAASFYQRGETERVKAVLLAVWDAYLKKFGGWDNTREVPRWIILFLVSHPYLLTNILRFNISQIIYQIIRKIRK